MNNRKRDFVRTAMRLINNMRQSERTPLCEVIDPERRISGCQLFEGHNGNHQTLLIVTWEPGPTECDPENYVHVGPWSRVPNSDQASKCEHCGHVITK